MVACTSFSPFEQFSEPLTPFLLSGGWVPGISKGFHFWWPAPRLNNAPVAGTTLQPSQGSPCQGLLTYDISEKGKKEQEKAKGMG